MEFRFNLNEIFNEVVVINNHLIPPGFNGDKRALWDTQSKVVQIVNAMGEASAAAQGLSKPITTADRLRNSEHRLYLLVDQSANHGKGSVTGMLKIGEKSLYVFDREGQHYQVSPPCVLDFYIHESRQRAGFGKRLFEHMLELENTEPVKLAIDRPSDKFLSFLHKHYGLHSPVKQMNNYVVFDGFFPKSSSQGARTMDTDQSSSPRKRQSTNGVQSAFPSSPYGRYAAHKPPCSMGQIIHNDSPVIQRNSSQAGEKMAQPVHNRTPKADRPNSLNIESAEELEQEDDGEVNEIKEIDEKMEKVEIESKQSTPMSRRSGSPGIAAAGIVTPRRSNPGLTEEGYFDLKFYHNKLW